MHELPPSLNGDTTATNRSGVEFNNCPTAPTGLHRHSRRDRGATLVEYAMLVAMISIAAIVSLRYLGTSTSNGISRSNSSMFVAP
jgi:Flp pilus assembly pilin Flp